MHQAMLWMTAQWTREPSPWVHAAAVKQSKSACDNWDEAQRELKKILDRFVDVCEMITCDVNDTECSMTLSLFSSVYVGWPHAPDQKPANAAYTWTTRTRICDGAQELREDNVLI